MTSKNHWESIYASKPPESLSWYQAHADESLRLLQAAGLPLDAAIIDVGGGASTLVDDLLNLSYQRITVLDLSSAALAVTRERLAERAAAVQWLEADILTATLPDHAYDVWHDRAVFHFLNSPVDQQAYVRACCGRSSLVALCSWQPLQKMGLPRFSGQVNRRHAMTLRLSIDDQSNQDQAPVHGAAKAGGC